MQPPSRETIEQALELYRQFGTIRRVARELNLPLTTVHTWLNDIGPRVYGTPRPDRNATPDAKGRREIDVETGVVFIAADAHYWPGEPSTGHKALIRFLKREKNLAALVMNGDAYDFS